MKRLKRVTDFLLGWLITTVICFLCICGVIAALMGVIAFVTLTLPDLVWADVFVGLRFIFAVSVFIGLFIPALEGGDDLW
ncbi:TPA: hypothetical protein JW533_003290 [Escherichia coli]|nr:hypothetical protein [Escherichia coli]